MIDLMETFLRLGAATLAGGAIGLNRDLRGKPTGVRTLGIVGLGSALAVLTATNYPSVDANDVSAISRTVQGVITGIGFLGAGVIIRNDTDAVRVHGLTTAACIWLTAAIGLACGIGAWHLLAVGLTLTLLVLLLGGPIERAMHRGWSGGAEGSES